jgi:hypothetical protein
LYSRIHLAIFFFKLHQHARTYKIKINLFFSYTFLYIIILLSPNTFKLFTININNFFTIFTLFSILYFIFFNTHTIALYYIFMYTLSLYFFIALNFKIIILCLGFVYIIKIIRRHTEVHLL